MSRNMLRGTMGKRRASTRLSERLKRLREVALARGNATAGTPGTRALAMMRASEKHPGHSWVEHRAHTLLELVREAPLSIGADWHLAGDHLFSTNTQALDWGHWGDHAAQ